MVASHHQTSEDAAEAAIRLSAEGREVYASIGLAPPGGISSGSKRLNVHEAIGVLALFADIDIVTSRKKARLPASIDEATEFLKSLGLHPSIVIKTGGGLQALWVFKEPAIFRDDKEKGRYKDAQRRWIDFINFRAAAKNWKFDPTKDIVRLCRVAGTLNRKYDPPAISKILISNGPRYDDLDAFDDLTASVPRSFARKADLGIDNLDVQEAKLLNEIKEEVQRSPIPPDEDLIDALRSNFPGFDSIWDGKRDDWGDDQSRYDCGLASVASKIGMTPIEAVRLIRFRRAEAGDDKGKADRADYLFRTVRRGMGFAEEPQIRHLGQSGSDLVPPSVDHDEDDSQAYDDAGALAVSRLAVSNLCGIEIQGFNQVSKQPDRIDIVLADGRSMVFGRITDLLDLSNFRVAFTRLFLKELAVDLKPKEFRPFVTHLLRMTTDITGTSAYVDRAALDVVGAIFRQGGLRPMDDDEGDLFGARGSTAVHGKGWVLIAGPLVDEIGASFDIDPHRALRSVGVPSVGVVDGEIVPCDGGEFPVYGIPLDAERATRLRVHHGFVAGVGLMARRRDGDSRQDGGPVAGFAVTIDVDL